MKVEETRVLAEESPVVLVEVFSSMLPPPTPLALLPRLGLKRELSAGKAGTGNSLSSRSGADGSPRKRTWREGGLE